jgi:NAD+ synthase (glutamine-hydrolysing)
MKIALAQMEVVPGLPERNFAVMRDFVSRAVGEQCRIIAFPEMCVGGYLLSDRWTESGWCEYLAAFNARIRDLSEDIAIVYGNVFVDLANKNKDGRPRKFNAGYGFYKRKPLARKGMLPEGVTIKSLLPNYRIFDDERYFFSLQEFAEDARVPIEELLHPFEIEIDGAVYKFGVEICEDLWFNDYRYQGKPFNISRYLVRNGAQFIFNLSASPWTYGKDRARNNRIHDSKRDIGSFVPFFYVNCVGVQNNGKNLVLFDGDSTVYNHRAEVVRFARAPFEEELLVFESALEGPAVTKQPLSAAEATYRAVVRGIRGMDDIMGNGTFPYVIGLSGGIDSAVVACLLCRAVGRERVIAFNLPTRYNSDATKSIAAHVAGKLGVRLRSIPIEELVAVNERLLSPFGPTEFNRENIQAKIRGTNILSNVAGIMNGLLTNNGNKVEIALGYATLYGDINGAIAPIGDLLKTEIFDLARFLNTEIFRDEVIPASLIPNEHFEFEVPPSAELRDKQVDPMKWGYHDALIKAFTDYQKTSPETVLEWYLDRSLRRRLHIPEKLFAAYGLHDPALFVSDLEWVVAGMQRAVYKRIQAPPIIILSKSSFGYDIRESQLAPCFTDKYRELKARILGRGTPGA